MIHIQDKLKTFNQVFYAFFKIRNQLFLLDYVDNISSYLI